MTERPPLSLTSSELRACQLASQHLTNKEIAAVMERSIPTVNRYISLGKAKLGVSTKRQIYAELKRRGLLGEFE